MKLRNTDRWSKVIDKLSLFGGVVMADIDVGDNNNDIFRLTCLMIKLIGCLVLWCPSCAKGYVFNIVTLGVNIVLL